MRQGKRKEEIKTDKKAHTIYTCIIIHNCMKVCILYLAGTSIKYVSCEVGEVISAAFTKYVGVVTEQCDYDL